MDGKRQFSMLGLGDIVIPGIFVAIVLRYDVAHGSRYFRRWGSRQDALSEGSAASGRARMDAWAMCTRLLACIEAAPQLLLSPPAFMLASSLPPSLPAAAPLPATSEAWPPQLW